MTSLALANRFLCTASITPSLVGASSGSVASAIIDKNPRVRVAVVEKESSWACHQSGRKSGVFHSGIYYKPGSLKAKRFGEGGLRLRQFCDRHNIRYENCGRVVVASMPAELPLLQKLNERAMANGLSVEKLSSSAVADIEPHVRCLEGLRVPSSGIVDYIGVCRTLVGLIQSRGGELRLGTKVWISRRTAAMPWSKPTTAPCERAE